MPAKSGKQQAFAAIAILLPALAACSDVQMLGAAAAENRRTMNDLQLRGSVAALCDNSYGAVMRSTPAQQLAHEVACGGLPEQITAPEPGQFRALEAQP